MINFACRHYLGSRPCIFNKSDGSECSSCEHASEFGERILFIKLDAIGDVLRSASLLPNIVKKHRCPYIAWLTKRESVELVRMMKYVDEVIELSDVGLARTMTGGWDHVYSLSNDITSASLATSANAKSEPVGYYVKGGIIQPSNEAARTWLEMAAFDRVKRANGRSYQDLMLSIIDCDNQSFARPAIDVPEVVRASAAARVNDLFGNGENPRIAINLGSGGRWPKKMLDVQQIVWLIGAFRQQLGADILLVGGAAEREKAEQVAEACADDSHVRVVLTENSIAEFAAILMQVDVLLCGDTLALHVATAINLPTVAVFGPTSVAEIPDFDGLITKAWVSGLDCLGCYGDCAKFEHCMSLFDLGDLSNLISRQLSDLRRPSGLRFA